MGANAGLRLECQIGTLGGCTRLERREEVLTAPRRMVENTAEVTEREDLLEIAEVSNV